MRFLDFQTQEQILLGFCESRYGDGLREMEMEEEECVNVDMEMEKELVARLRRGSEEEKRAAVRQLRVMAREYEDCRVLVAEVGGIEALVPLLRVSDTDMQEEAITLLLNLSVNPQVRVRITQTQGALDGVLELLSRGLSSVVKENAAATVFSLLIVEEYREEVGKHPLAIPALLELLRTAPTHRGRKDAIKGLFHLSLHQSNKPRVVAEGGVELLVSNMLQKRSGLVDESMSVLAALALCEEGANAIIDASALPNLVEILSTGPPRSRENALAVILALCQGGDARVFDRVVCYNHRIVCTLCSLLVIGSDRAKRKANQLMRMLVGQDSSSSSMSSSSSSSFHGSSSLNMEYSGPRARPL